MSFLYLLLAYVVGFWFGGACVLYFSKNFHLDVDIAVSPAMIEMGDGYRECPGCYAVYHDGSYPEDYEPTYTPEWDTGGYDPAIDGEATI